MGWWGEYGLPLLIFFVIPSMMGIGLFLLSLWLGPTGKVIMFTIMAILCFKSATYKGSK